MIICIHLRQRYAACNSLLRFVVFRNVTFSECVRNTLHYLFSFLITLAISKCYGKVRVLFFRATTLVSRGKSHYSRVRGLVVRCLLFNPEVSCSNRCVCANFFTSIPKQVSGTETPPIRLCDTFFENDGFFAVSSYGNMVFES